MDFVPMTNAAAVSVRTDYLGRESLSPFPRERFQFRT